MNDIPIPDDRTIRTLAHEYDAADVEPRKGSMLRRVLRPYWEAYGKFVRERAREISHQVTVKECRFEAYEDGVQIREDLKSGFIVVTLDYSPHPWWDLETNQASRLVHDVDGHAAADAGFTWEEEIRTLRTQALRTPIRFLPALFSQTLHQLSSTTHNKRFPDEQKVLITEHAEFRALALGTGHALPQPPNVPGHSDCTECDLEHPHAHVKKENPT